MSILKVPQILIKLHSSNPEKDKILCQAGFEQASTCISIRYSRRNKVCETVFTSNLSASSMPNLASESLMLFVELRLKTVSALTVRVDIRPDFRAANAFAAATRT